MRNISWRPVSVLLIAAFAVGPICANEGRDRDDDHQRRGYDQYAIGLWGDLPYSTLQATVGVPNLIADMNSQDLVFTVHDGDWKSGSSVCSDSVYTQAQGYLNSLRAPA